MTADGRKGLELSWNLLNLADSAAMHGSSLKYAWLSDGTKVSAKADDGSGHGVVKRYLGSFVYTTDGGLSMGLAGSLESIAWDEGRIFFDIQEAVPEEEPVDPDLEPEEATAWELPYRDCWFAGDHLGNVRSVIDITTDLPAPQILEQSDYLPFGTRIQNPDFISGMNNRWRYAGKEEQRFGLAGAFSPIGNAPFGGTGFLDLSLLDFGARMYDPFTARWTAVDPLAKACIPISPFVYCASNPIIVRDTDGNIIETVLDVASLAMGVKSFVSNVKQGNVGAAILDGVGIVADAVAVATPFVPGGVGAGIKAIRAGDKVADIVKGADKASDAAKIINKGESASKIGSAAKNTTHTDDLKNVIYEVPGSATESGKPYIGRTNDFSRRQHENRDGRDRTKAKIIGHYDPNNPKSGAIEEQKAINEARKKYGELDNKRNEIREKDWSKYGIH